jgi:hypothetical protein
MLVEDTAGRNVEELVDPRYAEPNRHAFWTSTGDDQRRGRSHSCFQMDQDCPGCAFPAHFLSCRKCTRPWRGAVALSTTTATHVFFDYQPTQLDVVDTPITTCPFSAVITLARTTFRLEACLELPAAAVAPAHDKPQSKNRHGAVIQKTFHILGVRTRPQMTLQSTVTMGEFAPRHLPRLPRQGTQTFGQNLQELRSINLGGFNSDSILHQTTISTFHASHNQRQTLQDGRDQRRWTSSWRPDRLEQPPSSSTSSTWPTRGSEHSPERQHS